MRRFTVCQRAGSSVARTKSIILGAAGLAPSPYRCSMTPDPYATASRECGSCCAFSSFRRAGPEDMIVELCSKGEIIENRNELNGDRGCCLCVSVTYNDVDPSLLLVSTYSYVKSRSPSHSVQSRNTRPSLSGLIRYPLPNQVVLAHRNQLSRTHIRSSHAGVLVAA